MANVPMAQFFAYAQYGQWAVGATRAAMAAGDNPVLYGNALTGVYNQSHDVIISGMSLRFVATAAGRAIRPELWFNQAGPNGISLESYTTAATDETRVWNDLNIPITLTEGIVFNPNITAALADIIILTLWGRWLVPTTEPQVVQPAPVSLEGYKWPLLRR